LMRVVARRRVTPDELERELKERSGKIPLSDLEMAIMEYEEDGETTLTIEEEVSPAVVRKLLSPRTLELIEYLERGVSTSISEIARVLGRSVPNVYNDIKFLERQGFVYLRKWGRLAIPTLLLEEIRIELG